MGGFEMKIPGMGGSTNFQDHHVYPPKYQVTPGSDVLSKYFDQHYYFIKEVYIP